MTTQICIQCQEEKALFEYYKHPYTANGRSGVCKGCHKARMKSRRRSNPAVQEHDRLRAKDPKRRAKNAATTYRWRKKNPDGYRAHYVVNNAVRDGKLAKRPCAICGNTRVHAHHADYSRPLDVIWLCPIHHYRGHADAKF